MKLGQYKIIKKPSIKFTEDKARVSTTSEDTLSQKKNASKQYEFTNLILSLMNAKKIHLQFY